MRGCLVDVKCAEICCFMTNFMREENIHQKEPNNRQFESLFGAPLLRSAIPRNQFIFVHKKFLKTLGNKRPQTQAQSKPTTLQSMKGRQEETDMKTTCSFTGLHERMRVLLQETFLSGRPTVCTVISFDVSSSLHFLKSTEQSTGFASLRVSLPNSQCVEHNMYRATHAHALVQGLDRRAITSNPGNQKTTQLLPKIRPMSMSVSMSGVGPSRCGCTFEWYLIHHEGDLMALHSDFEGVPLVPPLVAR